MALTVHPSRIIRASGSPRRDAHPDGLDRVRSGPRVPPAGHRGEPRRVPPLQFGEPGSGQGPRHRGVARGRPAVPGSPGPCARNRGQPGRLRRAARARRHAHRADLLPLRHQADPSGRLAPAQSTGARLPARTRRGCGARGGARRRGRQRAGRPVAPCPRRLGRQGPHLVSSARPRADGRPGSSSDGQCEVHLRRRGGDRQPVLRAVHRSPPRPAGRGRRPGHGRTEARERTADDHRRRARRVEDRARHRGGSA